MPSVLQESSNRALDRSAVLIALQACFRPPLARLDVQIVPRVHFQMRVAQLVSNALQVHSKLALVRQPAIAVQRELAQVCQAQLVAQAAKLEHFRQALALLAALTASLALINPAQDRSLV